MHEFYCMSAGLGKGTMSCIIRVYRKNYSNISILKLWNRHVPLAVLQNSNFLAGFYLNLAWPHLIGFANQKIPSLFHSDRIGLLLCQTQKKKGGEGKGNNSKSTQIVLFSVIWPQETKRKIKWHIEYIFMVRTTPSLTSLSLLFIVFFICTKI